MPTPIAFEKNPNIQIQQQKPKDAKPTETKQWTKEEVDDLARTTLEGLGWENVVPADAPKKEATPAKPEPKPEDKDDKPDATKPRKEPKPDMADRIASKVSAENAKLVAQLRPPPERIAEPLPPAPPPPTYSPKDERLRKIFQVMAELNPDDSMLPKKFDDFLALEKSYRQKWEAENPGEKFDDRSDEHARWYEKNEIEYDENDFARASTQADFNAMMEKRDRENLVRAAVGHAMSTAEAAIESVSEALEADTQAKMKEFGAAHGLEIPEEILQEGPVAEKFQSVVNALDARIRETALLMIPATGTPFDKQNPVHADIMQRITEFDADIATHSAADQRKLVSEALGKKSKLLAKQFSPMAEYQGLSREEREKHWTIASEPVLAAKLMAVQAQAEIGGWIEGLFKQVGRKNASAPATGTPPDKSGVSATSTSPGAVKPNPPSLSPSATDVTQQPGETVKGGNSWEELAKTF